MKLALLSDVHGNLPALEAVLADIEQWQPDQVIANGDFINRGPNSLDCLRWAEHYRKDLRFIQGNHEELVLRAARAGKTDDSAYTLRRFAHWTALQIAPYLPAVAGWERERTLRDAGGGEVEIMHGTRLGNRDGIHPTTSSGELPQKLGESGTLFVTSHTHRPLITRHNGTLVVNTGSVGSSFDRDCRAAYARCQYRHSRWEAEIVRIRYDRHRAEKNFDESGFLSGAGPLARIMLLEFQHCRGYMAPWMHSYEAAVRSGSIAIEDAVDRYLKAL
ncbi:MAG: metallophosphoesterase family protein [Gammaproteobacteria bacterium]|nr:metallophosphoesterase family protein [Gammaproteobacteria bacterium]